MHDTSTGRREEQTPLTPRILRKGGPLGGQWRAHGKALESEVGVWGSGGLRIIDVVLASAFEICVAPLRLVHHEGRWRDCLLGGARVQLR